MKLVVDIVHPADVNFFKNAVKILKNKFGIEIELVILPREGVLPIAKEEFKNEHIPLFIVGTNRRSVLGKSLSLVTRTISLLKYFSKTNADIITAFGGIGSSQAAYLLRKPSVIFYDDLEYKLAHYSFKFFASRIVVPESTPVNGKKYRKFNGFKELAYLHPKYFTPTKEVLNEYGLKPLRYVFLREVSKGTLNYRHLSEGQLSEFCGYLNDMNLTVVVSLENKGLRSMFEKENCIILKEPVKDIHSLLAYALFTLSSGDTMARESCLLGTPCIYTGGRKMSVNRELEKMGCLISVSPFNKGQILQKIREVIENDLKKETQRMIKNTIKTKWDDTTKVIIDNILEFAE
ncbi:DUF354 domain-containing protein [Thermococcus waiotapuensis]|uniref:DUF354 domain-containing protein n=1 Tax=Thermococcus waiotapuensis TaxID=90909 RepID=A0AAE4T3S1_9EURY|nr:DUF354 domain-containing protein [Thermococcus waiotapuensis]MDV3104093.1 DUF354 domain-containing protein [Thermococcus waiotapuensis]